MFNVLIVDDEEAVRLSVRYLADFEKRGISNIYEASNGNEARQIMYEHKIHILLTDICMSGQDGIFLMNWVRAHFPETKIIAISGYQNFDYILQSMRNGAMDYLLKPIDPARLDMLLDAAIRELNGQSGENDFEVFEQLRGYIEKNYDKFLYLDDLAKRFGFNASYLSRRFKQKYGDGIIEYVTKIRIQKAKESLVSSDMKLKDLAARLGYKDEKYFSRVFAQTTGMSPNAWRRKAREESSPSGMPVVDMGNTIDTENGAVPPDTHDAPNTDI